MYVKLWSHRCLCILDRPRTKTISGVIWGPRDPDGTSSSRTVSWSRSIASNVHIYIYSTCLIEQNRTEQLNKPALVYRSKITCVALSIYSAWRSFLDGQFWSTRHAVPFAPRSFTVTRSFFVFFSCMACAKRRLLKFSVLDLSNVWSVHPVPSRSVSSYGHSISPGKRKMAYGLVHMITGTWRKDDPTVEVKDFIYDIDFGQRWDRLVWVGGLH